MRRYLPIFLLLVSLLGLSRAGAAIPGQIVANPAHPQWLERTDGSQIFICSAGDPEGFLFLGSRLPDGTRIGGGQADKIQRLIDEGGNALYIMGIRSHGGDGQANENPFIDTDPNLGINQDILDQWDGWFSMMDQAGIVIYFFFYDDSSCIWGCNKSSDHTVPPEELSYIETIVNRFEDYKNIVWLPAEEYMEAFSLQRTTNIAAAIRNADDHDHPIGSHQWTGNVFHHADDPLFDHFAVQCEQPGGGSCDPNTTPPEMNETMNSAWTNAAGRYNLALAEIRWGGTGYGTRARQLMWASAMGGAYFLGQEWSLTSDSDPPDSNLNECRYLQNFLESARLRDMGPDNSRALEDSDYALVDEPGRAYVVYTDSYVSGMGITDLPAGGYDLTWLDTVSGTTFNDTLLQTSTGNVTLTRPGALGSAEEIAVYFSCEDGDGDGTCGFLDNCTTTSNPGQGDLDLDGAGDACDVCTDSDGDGFGDPGFPANQCTLDLCVADPTKSEPGICGCGVSDDDSDLDLLATCHDNCPARFNPAQVDRDSDTVGDACDPDDGLLYLAFASNALLEWQVEGDHDSWNLYRGDLEELRSGGSYTQTAGQNPIADRSCGLLSTQHADGFVAPLGETVFFVVSGSIGGVEQDLGSTSTGALRSNTDPCP